MATDPKKWDGIEGAIKRYPYWAMVIGIGIGAVFSGTIIGGVMWAKRKLVG